MERYIIYLVALFIVIIAIVTLIAEKRKAARLLKRLEETEESLGVAIETADMFFFDYYPDKKIAIAIFSFTL